MSGRRSQAACAASVAILAALAGCGHASNSSTGAPEAGPLVVYDRAGGLAYSRIHLVVESNGSAVVQETGPTGVRRQPVTVDADRLARLRRLTAAVSLSSLPKRRQLGCADCYQYVLAYGGAHYATDEASVPPSLRPVIAALESIVSGAGTAAPAGK